jgi:hypothetical protein
MARTVLLFSKLVDWELGDAWRWRKASRACHQQGLVVSSQGRSETMDCILHACEQGTWDLADAGWLLNRE